MLYSLLALLSYVQFETRYQAKTSSSPRQFDGSASRRFVTHMNPPNRPSLSFRILDHDSPLYQKLKDVVTEQE
jgi:hypothetical protein